MTERERESFRQHRQHNKHTQRERERDRRTETDIQKDRYSDNADR